MAPARVLDPCPGDSTPGPAGRGVRQAAVEPGQQEEEENSRRPALKSSTLLLAALLQLRQITSGALESREGLEGEGLPVLGREEGAGGWAGEQWLGRCRLSVVYPLRAKRGLSCLSGIPSPTLRVPCARQSEVTSRGPGSGHGLVEIPRSRRRYVLVSLLGARRAFLGEGGETKGRHLASRGQPLLPGCPSLQASPACGRDFLESSRRSGWSRAES